MIKKGDFIEIDFVGKIKDTGDIFDLTDEKLAKEKNLYNSKMEYGPVIICVGQQEVIKGLDKELENKDMGEFEVSVKAEEAFGKKDAKLIKIMSNLKFRQQKINPFPGLKVAVDGMLGTVRSVSGGRIVVDFNHPLAGKDVIYKVNIKRIVTNNKEKVNSILKKFGIKKPEVELINSELRIKNKVPKELQEIIIKRIKELVKTIKTPKFIMQNE